MNSQQFEVKSWIMSNGLLKTSCVTRLYQNNFINNGWSTPDNQSYDGDWTNANTWFHTSLNEGNYWDDHTGPDIDRPRRPRQYH